MILRSLAFAALALTGLAPSALAAPGAPADVLFDESFTVREGQQLEVTVGSGNVRVETTAGTEASVVVEGSGRDVRAEFARLRFTAEVRGGRLVVRTNPARSLRMRSSRASFVYTVRIPRRFSADVNTGSGSVRVGPLDGTLSVDSGSGNVQTDDVRGSVTVDTGSGSVQLGRVSGRLSVDTGSGSVSIAEQSGPASIDTGSGSVSVALARVDLLAVETGSGSVTVSVPRGADADVSASGGSVRIDDALAFEGRRERDGATGRIGRGGARLSLETGSGTIRLAAR